MLGNICDMCLGVICGYFKRYTPACIFIAQHAYNWRSVLKHLKALERTDFWQRNLVQSNPKGINFGETNPELISVGKISFSYTPFLFLLLSCNFASARGYNRQPTRRSDYQMPLNKELNKEIELEVKEVSKVRLDIGVAYCADIIPTAGYISGLRAIISCTTDGDYWLQFGIIVLSGAGRAIEGASEGKKKSCELLLGPTLKMQFGNFSMGISYLFGMNNLNWPINLATCVMLKFDYHVHKMIFTGAIALIVPDDEDAGFLKGLGTLKLSPKQSIRIIAGATYRFV